MTAKDIIHQASSTGRAPVRGYYGYLAGHGDCETGPRRYFTDRFDAYYWAKGVDYARILRLDQGDSATGWSGSDIDRLNVFEEIDQEVWAQKQAAEADY